MTSEGLSLLMVVFCLVYPQSAVALHLNRAEAISLPEGGPANEPGYANALALDAQSRLYATDGKHHRLVVFDSFKDRAPKVYGRYGSGPGEFSGPAGVYLNTKEHLLVISDKENDRLSEYRLEATGEPKFLRTLGGGVLKWPVAVVMRDSGEFIVADFDGIKTLAPDGSLRKRVSATGDGSNQVNQPQGLCLLSTQEIVVADKGNGRILLWRLDKKDDEIVATKRYESQRGWYPQSLFGASQGIYFGEYRGIGGQSRLGVLSSGKTSDLTVLRVDPIALHTPKWISLDQMHIFIVDGRDGRIWIWPRDLSRIARVWPWLILFALCAGAFVGSRVARGSWFNAGDIIIAGPLLGALLTGP